MKFLLVTFGERPIEQSRFQVIVGTSAFIFGIFFEDVKLLINEVLVL